jgi:hypothetical protein
VVAVGIAVVGAARDDVVGVGDSCDEGAFVGEVAVEVPEHALSTEVNTTAPTRWDFFMKLTFRRALPR